jgi:hypothetical protein
MTPLREWDYPHLFWCYAVLLCIWVPLVYEAGRLSSVIMSYYHWGWAIPPDLERVADALTILALAIPVLAMGVTVRVFLNELRWRREGDLRGR